MHIRFKVNLNVSEAYSHIGHKSYFYSHHQFNIIVPYSIVAQFILNNAHKRGLKEH